MFRFTIRDVLWLTVVVAIGAGWGIDRTLVTETSRAAYFQSQLGATLDELDKCREELRQLRDSPP